MGTFIALESAEDSFKTQLRRAAAAAGHSCAVISLRALRRLPPEGDAAKWVLRKVAELVAQVVDGEALLVLEDFDVWAPIKRPKGTLEEESRQEAHGKGDKPPRLGPPLHDKGNEAGLWGKWQERVVRERGTEDKIFKTNLSWVYRVLYLLRYSLAFRLQDDDRRLVCIALYASPAATRSFFADIFHHTYEAGEFPAALGNLGLGFNISSAGERERGVGRGLAGVSRYVDTVGCEGAGLSIRLNELYHSATRVAVKNDVLQIPFNVNSKQITISNITLICGEQGSGKTTLLNAVIKAWVQGDPVSVVHLTDARGGGVEEGPPVEGRGPGEERVGSEQREVGRGRVDPSKGINVNGDLLKRRSAYRLEYYNIVSQYVGCGESYIRRIFQKARNNKPALVAIDQVELLFRGSAAHSEEAQGYATLARTLVNELDALDEGVVFVAAASGNVAAQQLPAALTSLNNTTIVLRR